MSDLPPGKTRSTPDPRGRALLLPVSGGRRKRQIPRRQGPQKPQL
jgi:hypothetical protein